MDSNTVSGHWSAVSNTRADSLDIYPSQCVEAAVAVNELEVLFSDYARACTLAKSSYSVLLVARVGLLLSSFWFLYESKR